VREAAGAGGLRNEIHLLLKGYILGTLFSAIALHVAISLISPGAAGTMNALGDAGIFLAIFLVLGLMGLITFLPAAALSWPFLGLVLERPLLAFIVSVGVGVTVGVFLTIIQFRIGPRDVWAGSLVGGVFGIVWFFVVRTSFPIEDSDLV
jgi:hypothetical protein